VKAAHLFVRLRLPIEAPWAAQPHKPGSMPTNHGEPQVERSSLAVASKLPEEETR
jgi:hypothetical protein